jgi:hypothetical protein
MRSTFPRACRAKRRLRASLLSGCALLLSFGCMPARRKAPASKSVETYAAFAAVVQSRPATFIDSLQLMAVTGWGRNELRAFQQATKFRIPVKLFWPVRECVAQRNIVVDPPSPESERLCVIVGVYAYEYVGSDRLRIVANWRPLGKCGGYTGRFLVRYTPLPVTVISDSAYFDETCTNPYRD